MNAKWGLIMNEDARQIIRTAIKVLKENNVHNNLSYLIGTYEDDSDIKINFNAKLDASLSKKLKISEISLCRSFKDKNNIILIVIANLNFFTFPDGESDESGELFVICDGECVLRNKISRYYRHGTHSYSFGFSETSIVSLKLGDWIDHIQYIVKTIDAAAQEEEETKLKGLAAKIDLGKYKK